MINRTQLIRFNRAVQFEKHGHYENALLEYIELLKDDPRFRNAYVNLGSLYSRMNRLSMAMKCYEAALALGRDYITYFNIGCIYYKMAAYHDAITNLETSSSMNAEFALSKLVAGLCYSRISELAQAENKFMCVLEIWPNNLVALTALAIIFFNQNRFNQSLQLLNKILKLNGDKIKIRELKSEILLKTGRFDESANEIKIVKKQADGYRFFDEYIQSIPIETLTDRYGTIDEKINALNKKLDEDPHNLITLSLCHLFKGNTDEAIDYLFKFKK
jgi:tetratricopeptide (TPR) repeat protein